MHPANRARLRKKHQARIERVESDLGVDASFLVNRDPLRPEAIPKSASSMEIDWAPDIDERAPRPRWWFNALVITAVMFGLRLLPSWTGTTILYLTVIAFGFAVALYDLVVRKDRGSATAAAIAGPLAVLVVSATNPLPAFLLFAIALVLGARLAGRAAHHEGDLLHADLLSANEVRRSWRELWKPRAFLEHVASALAARVRLQGEETDAVLRRDRAERDRFNHGYLAVAFAIFAGFAVLVVTPIPLLAGLFALLASGLVLWGYAKWDLADYQQKHNLSSEAVKKAVRYGESAWFGYDWGVAPAPGVYRSSEGNAQERFSNTLWCYRVFAAAVVLLAAYFPLLLAVQGPGPWQRQNEATAIARLGDAAPTLAGVRQRLPESTLELAKHVPEESREAYLEAATAVRYRAELSESALGSLLPLESAPESWVLLSAWGLFNDFVPFALALALGILGCAFVPALLFRGLFLTVAGRALVHHYQAFESEGDGIGQRAHRFEAITARLRNSADPLEQRHLWLGVSKEGGHPVLLDREALEQHAHIMGGSKSGKTSLGLAPLLHQLVGPDCSVVVLDLKGDQSLFEEARAQASRTDCTFKWFTSESGESTFVFNPLTQRHMASLTAVERADIYTRALGLDHGEGYGRIHFSRANRAPLLKLLQLEPEVDSFEQLARGLRQRKDELFSTRRGAEHADDLYAVVDNLALVDAMNVTSPRPGSDAVEQPLTEERRRKLMEHAIDMGDALEEPSVYYFKLPGALHTASDREIGKFALNALLTAAYKKKEKKLPVYLVIDEFQMLVSEDISVVLEQARSMGIYVILSNQSPSQLRKVGTDVLASIEANTGFQQIFSIHDSEYRKVLGALSGETIYVFTSRSYRSDDNGLAETETYRQDIGPEMRTNDFMRMSARSEECWVHIKHNYGYSQFDGKPFLIYPDHHIDQAEYQKRLDYGRWPLEEEHPGTLTAPLVRSKEPEKSIKPAPKKKPKRTEKKPEATQQDLPLTEPKTNSLQQRLDKMELDDE